MPYDLFVIYPLPTLAILTDPGMLVVLVPVAVVLLGIVTFEIAMGITISTLPRSRFQQKWTPQEQRRVLRVFAGVFSLWPTIAAIVLAHLFLPLWLALLADTLVLGLIVLGVRWLMQGIKQRKLIQAGHCVNCFYDLRASHESDHCPECGVALDDHPNRLAGDAQRPAGHVKDDSHGTLRVTR